MQDEVKQKDFCNVLYISSFNDIGDLSSLNSKKILELSKILGELHVIYPGGFNKKVEKRGESLFVYPTKFFLKIIWIFEVIRIAFFQVTWRFHFRAQIVFADNPIWSGLVGYFIALKKKRPLVVCVDEDFFSRVYKFSSIKRFIYSLISDFVVSHSNYIFVPSQRIKNSLIIKHKNLNNSIHIIPRVIDWSRIQNTENIKSAKDFFKDPGFIITMAGPFWANKRIPLALNVFERILKRYPRTNLLLLGDGPGARLAHRLSKHKKFKDKIFVYSTKTDNEFYSILKSAHLFLITSSYENSDGFVIDALSASLPVVSTDTGIIRDVFGGLKYQRYVCEIDNSDDIFQKVLELIENLGIRNDFRLNAKDLINKSLILSPDTWSENVSDILFKICKNKL